MKKLLKTEEAAMAALSIYFMTKLNLPFSWWWFIPLFFIPDISLVGIAMRNRTGVVIYTLFHNKVIAITLWLGGVIMKNDFIILAGLILFGHSSFDRLLGFKLNPKQEI